MCLHDVTKIKQRPLTDSMTPEELKQYEQEVREARYANPATHKQGKYVRWVRVEPKPMSDYLTYKPRQHKSQEVFPMMFASTQTKTELIKKWTESISKLRKQIEVLSQDTCLSVAERQKKIARREEIIKDYEFSIKQAREYLDAWKQHVQEINNQMYKSKNPTK